MLQHRVSDTCTCISLARIDGGAWEAKSHNLIVPSSSAVASKPGSVDENTNAEIEFA